MKSHIQNSLWLTIPNGENSFAIFRTAFTSDKECLANLEISADTAFEAYLNGSLLPLEQAADPFPQKSVNQMQVELRHGRNVLAILLFYSGSDSLGYHANNPGLAVAISENDKMIERSGKHWKYSRNTAYTSGLKDKITWQLGFCFEYDAQKEFAWQQPDFDDSSWEQAIEDPAFHPDFFPRPVTTMISRPLQRVKLAQAGYLIRSSNKETAAQCCASDFLLARPFPETFEEAIPVDCNHSALHFHFLNADSPPLHFRPCPPDLHANGCYLLVDLGRECVGWLNFQIEAPAGTVVDIAHGEHLDDGRVRCHIDHRNFADRFICKNGENHFCHRFRRLGARYLEFHFTNTKPEQIALGFCQLISRDHPLPVETEFRCDDRLLLHLRKVSIDTLKLCMHEHYEDCPWREQALYAGDSRVQMLYGYYLWGNYPFARNSLDLIGKNYWQDGYLQLCAPGRAPIVIIPGSFTWLLEMWEYILYSGDDSLVKGHEKVIRLIIEKATERMDGQTGLYYPPQGEHIWNFYEWKEGLIQCPEKLQALYNLYLYSALKNASQLLQDDTLMETARTLIATIEKYFWDEASGVYRNVWERPELHVLTQTLMLAHQAVPESKIPRLCEAILCGRLVDTLWYNLPWLFQAFMPLSAKLREKMFGILTEHFDSILFQGATSLWETADGAYDFQYAGSLCHGWSCFPVLFCHSILLGVTPLDPGFKHFLLKPYPAGLPRASGSIKTPEGILSVAWEKQNNSITIKADGPKNIIPVLETYPEFSISSAIYNGRELTQEKKS